MATANVLELETCLEECIAYCGTHPTHEFVSFYAPRLEYARQKWEESVQVSDEHYLAWQKEARGNKISWRKLSNVLKTTQNQLRKVNAIGYPAETVRYWDVEILADYVTSVIAYLKERSDVLPNAAEGIETLTRHLDTAKSEGVSSDAALSSFKRHVLFRSEAMGTLNAAIADFRVAMRRSLGKTHDEYKGIRWPLTLAPDGPVL